MSAPLNFTGKIVGTNFVPRYGSKYGPNWNLMWQNFDNQWSEFQRQIDLSYGVGANVIRIVGSFDWIFNGTITRATNIRNWNTVLAYVASLGMACYACPAATQTSITVTQYWTEVNAWLAGIASYNASIIGVDLINELNAAPGGYTLANYVTIYDNVKPTTSLPLTASTYEEMTGTTMYDTIISSVDFLDYHVYDAIYADYPTTALLTNGPLSKFPTYETLIGEHGDPISAGDTHNENWFGGGWSMGMMANAKVRGAFQWAMTDQSNSTSDQWGMTDASYAPRILPVKYIIGMPSAAAGPSAPTAPKIPHQQVIIASPAGTTNDYAGMKFYRDGVLLSSPTAGYYNDTAMLVPGQSYTYTAKVSTVTHGDSVASAGTVFVAPYSPRAGGLPVFGG